ncbi:MAG: porphyrin biosynthesis protein [Burkholderiales bacterium PBB5]|nr:MAG: porphyrin biosynthesis protein [Burkholderiales bacterium PBB5]
MRSIVWLVLVFVVAVVSALTLGDNSGLASFYWEGWRVDLSLNFFVLAALGIGFAVVSAVQAVNALVGLPKRAREWRALRVERTAQAALREALTEYFSGRYSRSHKAAQRALAIRDDGLTLPDDHEFRTLGLLLAAGSLHRLQDRRRRDELLRLALRPDRRGSSAAVDDGARLLAAEWALDDRDGPRALALLGDLQPGVARRTQALRLKLQAARLERRSLDALHTARLLANHQAFSQTAAQGLLRSLAIEAIDAAHDADQLRRTWQQFDVADQRDPFVAARAARRAAQQGAAEEGRAWLRPLWDRFDTSAAGAVLIERQLSGKARRPLELAANDKQLGARARRQAWRGLARLAEAEDDVLRAQACLREAASID